MNNKLIYFDNAATGYPKPECVRKAAFHAFEECGGNPGRSGHILSANASKAVFKCREAVCDLIKYNSPENVVFTLNATHALNISIKGLAKRNSHIIISNLEHNSVYRPVYSLCNNSEFNTEFSVFDVTAKSDFDIIENFKKEIRASTDMAVITVASNICGRILPICEIGEICKSMGIKLILDASQALGETEFDFTKTYANVVCSAGHKGLYGPTGTGFAVFADGVIPSTIIQGGNGLVSELPDMGKELPEMLEAGTLNTFGICGLCEGIKYIKGLDIECIKERNSELEMFISDGLKDLGAILYSEYTHKTPIILFNIPGISPAKVSSLLDERGICTRSGLHCSVLAHNALATGKDGAVRVSLGIWNNLDECKKFLKAIKEILSERI